MSFFGFDANIPDSQRFSKGGQHEEEDVAVYTWGDEGYDGLGDALDEGGDDLNDETFGDSGRIGRDFNFNQSTQEPPAQQQYHLQSDQPAPKPRGPASALWDDKSPASVLPRMSFNRGPESDQYRKHGPRLDPMLSFRTEERLKNPPPPVSYGHYNQTQNGAAQAPARTLQEIEAELRASALKARDQSHSVPQTIPQPIPQPLLSAIPQQQPAPPPQPGFDQNRVHQRQLSMEHQFRNPHVMQPPLPVQQFPQLEQMQMYQQHQYMMNNVSHLPPALQQQLMAQAQADFPLLPDPRFMPNPDQSEAVLGEAMRKIMEAEQMEARRRRKAAKIARMSKYNDLMTQSDKDFITRIQVSQLVTQDPYAEDFYAQVFGAILRSRMGAANAAEGGVLKFGAGGGVGLGLPGARGAGRRENAMQRMQAQVERIVSNAKNREIAKGPHPLSNLQGALGKTSGRSYKAAPRQLLQVETTSPATSPSLSSAQPVKSALTMPGPSEEVTKLAMGLQQPLGTGVSPSEPLSHRQVLVELENLYDLVLKVEQLRRIQPTTEQPNDLEAWTVEYDELVDQLWTGMKVMVPLETSDPHPFISFLTPVKGKRLLPRVTRHLAPEQMLTLLTLLVACFGQLDVAQEFGTLDQLEDSRERRDVERQTQTFMGAVLPTIIPVVAKANLRLVGGLLGLLMDRNDVALLAKSRPGSALLTLFLSRVEVVKQRAAAAEEEAPHPEDVQQWQRTYDHLFHLLSDHLLTLFPSTRAAALIPFGTPYYGQAGDVIRDQPVWQFLAALALHSAPEQQQILVTRLRDKVMDNVMSASEDWVADETEREAKIGNVNLFLHALGLEYKPGDGATFGVR